MTPQPVKKPQNNIQQHNEALTWRPLRHFNYYRLTLSLVLFLFFHNAFLEGILGKYNPEAYLATVLVFALSSLLYIFLGLKKILNFESQVILATSSDILLITLMTHFSGGLGSALGILLIINIAATGTFLKSRDSFLFAALASIAVLTEQTSAYLNNITNANAYAISGILGIAFFGSSILASTLSKRLRESEAIASQKSADLISLENLNEHIIQNMRTGILVVNDKGNIRMANSSAEALLGNISLKSNPSLKNILPALNTRFQTWQKQPQILQSAIRQQQGLPDIQPGFRQLDSSTNHSSNTLIFLEDATQLNQRFQQIKLASLGRLTASIAHEIRNPLSAINHAAQLLNESQLNDTDTNLTNIITTQVQRLDKVIQNVLQLSRQEQSTPETIHLNEWLNNFKQEFCASHELKEKQFEIKVFKKNMSILFDSSHLYQVISNLSENAIHHSNKARNEVLIKITIDYDNEQQQPCLDIMDNGPGIDMNLVQQIFDPFFTTSSKGTGLGLYISKEIIESNRAKIRYLKSEHDGWCFKIHFLSSSKDN